MDEPELGSNPTDAHSPVGPLSCRAPRIGGALAPQSASSAASVALLPYACHACLPLRALVTIAAVADRQKPSRSRRRCCIVRAPLHRAPRTSLPRTNPSCIVPMTPSRCPCALEALPSMSCARSPAPLQEQNAAALLDRRLYLLF
ncbi:hypothetical protein PVAP13_6NG193500 [Panicum virgatum]|uniref:Uncharacterized protein n=1 Tax=Panicum virgatum TaxID=38727 RepID=A0A8T0QWR4_PANVG|nr:hypothetical protein PVAP13_6NG193500 [Panicum virgatum]